MTPERLQQRLSAGLPAHTARLEARTLQAVAAGWPAWLAAQERVVMGDDEGLLLCRYLAHDLAVQSSRMDELQQMQGVFNRRLAAVHQTSQRQRLMLDFAAQLGASGRALRQDEQAFERWFDADALQDRVRYQIGLAERRMTVVLERLGATAAELLAACPASEVAARWAALALEPAVHACMAHPGHVRVRVAAFTGLATALRALPTAQQEASLSPSSLQLIYRLSLDASQAVWLQCEALALLWTLSHTQFASAAQARLASPKAGDDFFVRRRITLLLAEDPSPRFNRPELLALVRQDPSASVRQALADMAPRLTQEEVDEALPALLLHDAEPTVRAAAALALPHLPVARDAITSAWLCEALSREQDAFVSRTLLLVSEQWVARGLQASAPAEPAEALPGLARLLTELDRRHRGDTDLRVRRWAAQAAEHIAMQCLPAAREWAAQLAPLIQRCAPGRSAALPKPLAHALATADLRLVSRVLSVLARHDHALALEAVGSGWRLHRGHRFGFRAWRWWHEVKNPSPDKRQAHRHTIGRIFRGQYHAPSAILAELAQTKVPGEPLQMASEAGHRPYLPLIDQLISALDEPPAHTPLMLCSAEGMTLITPPKGLLARLRARWRLSWRVEALGRLRNVQEEGQGDVAAYINAVRALGFGIDIEPHPDALGRPRALDPAVARFFAAAAAADHRAAPAALSAPT